TISAMAAANGIGRMVVGQGGLLSTPAASNLIRTRNAAGGIILSASHNPGGPDGDFGIKFNTATGGQAPEQLTEAAFASSLVCKSYKLADLTTLDIDKCGETVIGNTVIEIVDPVSDYAELMEEIFDFELLRSTLKHRVRLHFDALNAVTGPYAQRIFCDMLGVPDECICNATPLEDFGGIHPDPNPVQAAHLVKLAMSENAPDLIGASDGDGDRYMILGSSMLVSPGDSLAIMLANTVVAPGYRNGVPGVARSMPTSRAVDAVAHDLGIPCFETPTGWRFFCNLLEAGKIGLCGEESFGTSSAHTREKDGLWAVLYWLSMMAGLEQSVGEIVRRHWARFGRCFFQRRDYVIADLEKAEAIIRNLTDNIGSVAGSAGAGQQISEANIFEYTDPVDGSVSTNQGIRLFSADGGRIVLRLSGTGTSGATLRVYLDRTERGPGIAEKPAAAALSDLAGTAAEIARIEHFTGLTEPTAII
ncbi:MAG: alpha-D-glucose phosphate-specific phosphoglucomutase, partial [Gammaproteobacteria bacterium]|nr:alpha-D-glucose phosphate-specific phosphoglucomutase [Gammaproteobacteria bacterium]